MSTNNFRRDTAHQTARDTLALLAGTGYALPDTIVEAVERLDRLEALKPREATPQTLRGAYASGTADRAELEAHAARVVADSIARTSWGQARSDVALSLQREISVHVADVIEHLRPAAQKIIDELTWYAHAGAPDTTALLRSGKTKDAQRVASMELHHTELDHLRKVRKAVSPREFPWTRLGWENPERLPETDATGLAYVVEGIKAGAGLWWPTWSEALSMVDRLERQDAEAAQVERDRHNLQRHMAL